jgi:hypothetical protein
MNEHFLAYINFCRELAIKANILWDVSVGLSGSIDKDQRWNLTTLTHNASPPTHWLSDLGEHTSIIERIKLNDPNKKKNALSPQWQNFIKAVTVEMLLVKKIKPASLLGSVVPPLKALATCNSQIEPWEIKVEHVVAAIDLAAQTQSSGALADWIIGVIKTVIDANNISNFGPLLPQLELIKRKNTRLKSTLAKSPEELLQNLDQRKRVERLPEKKAFWELVRIVFTEKPRTLIDTLRFAQIKVMFICGLRVGEIALIPADCKRFQFYTSEDGSSINEYGGYSRAFMLRHFAEKQKKASNTGAFLFENTQYVPKMFESILEETLDEILKITKPMRNTLEKQIVSNRIFPHFELNQLILAKELYTYLTGNPIFLHDYEEDLLLYKNMYQEQFDPTVFDKLIAEQLTQNTKFSYAFYMFFHRFPKNIPTYNYKGLLWSESIKSWDEVYYRISDIETFLKNDKKTKLSDTDSFKLHDTSIQPYELLFLMPK